MKYKLLGVLLSIILISCGAVVPVSAETSIGINGTVSRLAGQDYCQTSVAIANAYNNNGECNNIILVSGNSFPDTLSTSLLSKKVNAPILLVGTNVNNSSEAFTYMSAHVSNTGTVYIIGGTGVIGSDFETKLASMGYKNIKRLGGTDRYDTNMLLVNDVDVPQGTPVFIASGENFPDALSIASFSGSKQYPTLLVGANYLPEKTKNYLLNEKPSSVYIIGGTSVISLDLVRQINGLVRGGIIRLAGEDRFESNAAVLNKFSPDPGTLYLANGDDFQDVLLGSGLAAKKGDPIILADNQLPTLSSGLEIYLENLSGLKIRPNVIALGGSDVVSNKLMQQVNSVLDNISEEQPQNNVKSGFKLPENIISLDIHDDTSFSNMWTPNNQETVLAQVTDWLNKATPYKDKIPHSDELFISSIYTGPARLDLSTLDNQHIAIFPAYYIAKTGESIIATVVSGDRNGVTTTITTENPLYKNQYVRDVLVLDNEGNQTYVKSEPLYNWLKNDEWKAEFR